MIMELLRDAVLTICRQTFSKNCSGELKVKCHIEVSTDVSQIFSTSFEDVLCRDLSADQTDKGCACDLKESSISSDKKSCFVCCCHNPCGINRSNLLTDVDNHINSQVKLNRLDSASALDLQTNVRQGDELSDIQCQRQHDVTQSTMELSCTHSNSSENLEIVAVDDFFESVDQKLTSSDVGIFTSDSRIVVDKKSTHSCASPLHCDICHKMLQIHNRTNVSPGKRSPKVMDDATTQKSQYLLSSSDGQCFIALFNYASRCKTQLFLLLCGSVSFNMLSTLWGLVVYLIK